MIDIFVSRGLGPYKRGPDITEPLITELAVALARGQVEVDRNVPIRTVQLTTRFRRGLRVGQLVQVMDALQDAVWQGKITSVDNAVENAKMTTKLTVERLNG